MAYFPMFVDLKDKLCIIVGGGAVAYRKIKALLEFEARILVIAPNCIDKVYGLKDSLSQEQLIIALRNFDSGDVCKADLVIAATDDITLNKSIAKECRHKNIPVNVVDVQEECSFIFPAYIKRGAVTIGVTSSGKSPVISQRLKKSIAEQLPEYLEDLADILGEARDLVKKSFDTEAERKKVYIALIEAVENQNGKLSPKQIKDVIQREMKKNQDK
ncbi:siroheme synthase [Anaerocolumna cellulosilytica]|uniref:precorrin-2 dehydrogenase n=1 Tax=Anaerocolumna cellulosilytica TaxID=433286 RepID=A0A6S6R5I4_9FIRM|nr:bifunctional precorrin-2 dehydrogenase/sirohydrochlorin ferrochelatase [Anaerocolumna cellulosilytica]MBB5197154.1 siroheme synthase-like protein [Anaerocolumna cellulosilytica]BCJ95367.1 siroheme synthase [Anaerocolumna cellulosilytica]